MNDSEMFASWERIIHDSLVSLTTTAKDLGELRRIEQMNPRSATARITKANTEEEYRNKFNGLKRIIDQALRDALNHTGE
tara:strand:+ start:65 stop:304 length:240 start_codon:yes stop_codon:yes gene_type:complete